MAIKCLQSSGKSVCSAIFFACMLFLLSVMAQDLYAYKKSGTASYYSRKFNGRRTSSGERLDNSKLTAAHRSIPFGTFVRVTNQSNGKSVIVKINDRFYPGKDHLIDLTYAAAERIGMVQQGIARVRLDVLDITEADLWMQPADSISFRILPVGGMLVPVEKPTYVRSIDVARD